jgi:hemerythrin-like domain-containing protein
MLQDQCTGRALIAQMMRAVNARATKQVIEAARAYVDLPSEHIQKEDNVLFRVAQTLMDEHSTRSLQDDFNQAEAELPGSLAKYEQEAQEMESAWAV